MVEAFLSWEVFPSENVAIHQRLHCICASYHLDENVDIPCRIVDSAE